MRRYSLEEERRLRLRKQLDDWTRPGLVSEAQKAQMDHDLRTDLRRTSTMLRVGLALFTGVGAFAAMGLIALALDLNDEWSVGVLACLTGLSYVAVADWLVGRYRLYRHGVEEMLAVAGIVLVMFGVGLWVMGELGYSRQNTALAVALTTGAAGGFLLYRRFGFQYAAVAAIGCVTLVPFQLGWSHMIARLLACGLTTGVFFAARRVWRRYGHECPGDEGANLQAAALAVLYGCVNLHVLSSLLGVGAESIDDWFYAVSYVATWLLPAVGLWLGLRDRERATIDVSIAMLIVTLLTHKAYLGWARDTWDPMVLGVVLMASALVVRRWLVSGAAGQRGAYTSLQLAHDETLALEMAGYASAAFPLAPTATGDREALEFKGGRSGGAGAGADF